MIREDRDIPAIGYCEICGAKTVKLYRTYFYYPNIKCSCHSPHHFIIVNHCSACEPQEPEEQKVFFSKEQVNKINERMEDNEI